MTYAHAILLMLLCVAVMAAHVWWTTRGPRCWRCGGTTDSRGAPCPECRNAIHAERIRRMKAAGQLNHTRRG